MHRRRLDRDSGQGGCARSCAGTSGKGADMDTVSGVEHLWVLGRTSSLQNKQKDGRIAE